MDRKSPEGLKIEPGLRYPATGNLCQSRRKWVLLSNQEKIRQLKERRGMGSVFHMLFPRYSVPLPHCPNGCKLWYSKSVTKKL